VKKRMNLSKTAMSGVFVLVCIMLISCSEVNQKVVVPPFTIQGADFVGTDNCAMCHEETVQNFKYSDHANTILSEAKGSEFGVCEACHGPGSLHLEAGGGRGVYILNPGRKPDTCYQCHAEIKAAFSLQYRHPLRERRLSCIDCHDPHGEDIFKSKGMFVSRENEVCAQCHQEQLRPFVFEHEALRDGCSVCHNPHGSINDKLLAERDQNLCLKCHAQPASPGTVVIGNFQHNSQLAQGSCWSAGCHTAVHGSNINSSLRY
jgi:predicted CXXCH cytochrome family protein